MKSAEILYQLREVQTIWRQNNFRLTGEQQVIYDNLLRLRRERVQQFYKDNIVFKGAKATTSAI
jgi:hypothetical protein